LTIEAQGGDQPVRLTSEDLTRLLVNLVKNASEAMSASGRIEITLRESDAADEPRLTLLIEDSGPGIPSLALDRIFLSGYSTHGAQALQTSGDGAWPTTHRGLGLSISRSILEAAGGRIYASNRDQGGARFEIELPVRTC
jgi:signal transduction histidine kinase